jgi:Arm DNA-binding domain
MRSTTGTGRTRTIEAHFRHSPLSAHVRWRSRNPNDKQPGYYAVGGSLYLRVAPGGSKGWIFRFTIGGRTRDAGLGAFPTVSLIKAREEATVCRRLVAAGADPIEARKRDREAARIASEKAITFEQCAKAFIESHETSWRSSIHRRQWRKSLDAHVYPIIGRTPVQAVDITLILKVLEPIWIGVAAVGSPSATKTCSPDARGARRSVARVRPSERGSRCLWPPSPSGPTRDLFRDARRTGLVGKKLESGGARVRSAYDRTPDNAEPRQDGRENRLREHELPLTPWKQPNGLSGFAPLLEHILRQSHAAAA